MKGHIMASVIVVHGYTASPEENWFPWLADQAEKQNIALQVLRLDPSIMPELAGWTAQMDAQIEHIDENSIFIAHSLGCLATLHYLTEKLAQQRIRGLILVAGFNGGLGRLPLLEPFIDAAKIDFDLLKRQVGQRVVIYSKADDRVLPKYSLEQAKSLDATEIQAAHQGHFIDSEGCTELPEVWHVLQTLVTG